MAKAHYHLHVERPGGVVETLDKQHPSREAALKAAEQYAESFAANSLRNGMSNRFNDSFLIVGRDKVTDHLAPLEVTTLFCASEHRPPSPEDVEVETWMTQSEDRTYFEALFPLIERAQESDQTAERSEQPGVARLALKKALRRAEFRLDGLMAHGQHTWSTEGMCTVCGYDGNS